MYLKNNSNLKKQKLDIEKENIELKEKISKL